MTPTVDERLASIVRSLTEVILPHLPADASLAQEQVHLAVGHLQILRAQFDEVLAFEQDELVDAVKVAYALCAGVTGGAVTSDVLEVLRTAVAAADGSAPRDQASTIHRAVDALVKAVSTDGAAGAKAALSDIILEHESARVLKDRKWFLPYGFDTIVEAAA